MNLHKGITSGSQVGKPVIIGSAVGVAVLLVLVLISVVVVVVLITRQRTQLHEKPPGNNMVSEVI